MTSHNYKKNYCFYLYYFSFYFEALLLGTYTLRIVTPFCRVDSIIVSGPFIIVSRPSLSLVAVLVLKSPLSDSHFTFLLIILAQCIFF